MVVNKVLFYSFFLLAFDQRRSRAMEQPVSLQTENLLSSLFNNSFKPSNEFKYMPRANNRFVMTSRESRSPLSSFALRIWQRLRGLISNNPMKFESDRTKNVLKKFKSDRTKNVLEKFESDRTKNVLEKFESDRTKNVLENSVLDSKPAAPDILNLHFLKKTPLFEEEDSNSTQDEIEIKLNNIVPDNYHDLRRKWKYQLVSDDYNTSQPAIVSYVTKLSDSAKALYKDLNKKPQRTFLWQMQLGSSPSSDYTMQFQNLYKLTLAYGTNGTAYYKNKKILSAVLKGLEFMVKKKGYDGKNYHGDLWHWLIGVPDLFIKIIMILDEELYLNKMELYIRILTSYVSNHLLAEQMTPAGHSTSLAEIVLSLGILRNEEQTIRLALDKAKDSLKPVTEGGGFYPDGSFLQHQHIPLTGLHGRELIKSVAQILSITKDSEFELDPEFIQRTIDLIDRAFIPLIYEGELMAMVCGRMISRAKSNAKFSSGLIYDLLTISMCAPEVSQKKLQEAVKYWLRKNPNHYIANTRYYRDVLQITRLLQDDSIVGDELPFVGVKLYTHMDRFVQRTHDYMVGLSMYSSRVSAFDAGNNENKRGWHTADGMVYLYNEDEVQFDSAYWPTVDPYRLPGTTVDTVSLFDELLNKRSTSEENWVGGVAHNYQAVVGMSLNKAGTRNSGTLLNMDLRAKKSWFIVDGQIIALGAGITGKTNSSIETIVDNRLLNDKLDYKLFSNDGFINAPAIAALEPLQRNRKTMLDALWILLQESSNKASIGYYFPTKERVHLISERRSGTYHDINVDFMSIDNFARNYSKILIHHGKKPVNARYAYVLLPGITKDGLKAYVAANPVTILANTQDIQAVKIRDYNYIGINIWNELGGKIAGVSSDKPVSILIQTVDNLETYIVSDPTQSNIFAKVMIPEFTEIIKMSEGVQFDGEHNVFVIDFVNKGGASEQFTVLFVENKQMHA